MTRWMLLGAAVAGLAAPIEAQSTQVGFQGFEIGQTLEEARAVPIAPSERFGPAAVRCDDENPDSISARVRKPQRAAGMLHCMPTVLISGVIAPHNVPVGGGTTTQVDLEFLDGKLVRIGTSYPIEAEQKILDALKLRYGEPEEQRVDEVQTRNGVKHPRLSLAWHENGATVGVLSPAGSINYMDVSYWSPEAVAFDEKMRAAEASETHL